MEPTTRKAEQKVRQGVWGDTTTTLLPDAFELLGEDPEADSTPGRLDPQPTNEELVDKAKDSGESFVIIGGAVSSVSIEKGNLTRNSALPSGSSASKGMEVLTVVSITIIAAMTP